MGSEATLDIIYEECNGGKWPERAYEDDAGLDLVANGDENGMWSEKSSPDYCQCVIKNQKCPYHNCFLGVVYPGGTLKLKCGFKMALPRGWEADVRPRSGLATKRRLTPANTPGTIDAGYRDEIAVVLMNLGSERQDIYRGDKIAQMLFLPVPIVRAVRGTLPKSLRDLGGFGSTG